MLIQKLNTNVNSNVKETFFIFGRIWWNKVVTFRSSHQRCSTAIALCRGLVLSKRHYVLFVIVFWGQTNRSSLSQMKFLPAMLLKRDSNTGVFLGNLRNLEVLRTYFSTEQLRWLLLNKHRRSQWFIVWWDETLVI